MHSEQKQQQGVVAGMMEPVVTWWRSRVITEINHQAVVNRVRDDDGWTPRYAFMILMSAGIAILGLILNSPAVVIGAMLISPLMGPIVGLGFALATADSAEIRRTLAALIGGAVIAVAFTAFIVLLSPLQTLTSELAARTRPNLFDLVIALFSALAGTYAMIRGQMGTIVGVAIATALMPPLATVGFGLATLNSTVFFGAFLLFLTNFVTIAIAAAVMARIYGFGRTLSPRQTVYQSTFIVVILLALAIPLGFSLRQIAWEATASRQAHDVIAAQFERRDRISDLSMDFGRERLVVNASVLTHAYKSNVQQAAQKRLIELFARPVDVRVEQIRVSAGADAEGAQLAAAQANERQRAAARIADQIAEKLALIAGVPAEAVLVDRDARRALVRATPLPEAGLATYFALESRIAAQVPDWTVMVQPPALSLPGIAFDGENMTPEGTRALALAIWSGRRVGAPIGVSGPADPRDKVIEALVAGGVPARAGASNGGRVTLAWITPDIGNPAP